MKRILGEQWGHFLPSTLKRGRWAPTRIPAAPARPRHPGVVRSSMKSD